MHVKYTDGPAALDLPGRGRVERGEPIEVTDERGHRLIAQGWEQVDEKPKHKATSQKKESE